MKKLKKCAGVTLLEMLVAVMILTLLIIGIDVGMKAAANAYTESIFESNSSLLEGILNTALGDILRYADDLQLASDLPEEQERVMDGANAQFTFTSLNYGVKDAYLCILKDADGGSVNYIALKSLIGDQKIEVVNLGAYPQLKVENLEISCGPLPSDIRYLDIRYKIVDAKRENLVREVEHTVALLNYQVK